jgi:hypothetical protein
MSGCYPPHHPSPLYLSDFMSMVLGRLFLFADVLHIVGDLGCLFSTTTAGGLGSLVSTIKVRSTILSCGRLCSNTINPPLAFFDSPFARVVVGVVGGFCLDGCLQVRLLHVSVLQGLACFGCCCFQKILLGLEIDFGLCG